MRHSCGLFGRLLGWQGLLGSAPCVSRPSLGQLGLVLTAIAEVQEGTRFTAQVFSSLCSVFAGIPLARASHMAKRRGEEWGFPQSSLIDTYT